MIGKSAVDSALAKTRDVPAYLNSSSMATSFNTDSVAQISSTDFKVTPVEMI